MRKIVTMNELVQHIQNNSELYQLINGNHHRIDDVTILQKKLINLISNVTS